MSVLVTKPPLGAEVDWAHPINRDLVGCWLLNEGMGTRATDIAYGEVARPIAAYAWREGLRLQGGNAAGYGECWRASNTTRLEAGLGSMTILAWATVWQQQRGMDFGGVRYGSLAGKGFLASFVAGMGISVRNESFYVQARAGKTVIKAFGGTNIIDGRPHLLAGILDRERAQLSNHIDGKKQESTDATPLAGINLTMPTESFTIGGNSQSTARFSFLGHIHAVMVWKRALTDDEIAWLEKSDPQSLTVQISLNAARGKRALAQGDKRAAAEYLRKTIAGYESQPRTAAALNNCGLAYFNLYEATGNPDDHRRGMTLLEQAIELDPGDSILLQNTMFFLISRAVMDTVEDRILPEAIGSSAGLSPLSQLYNGDEERSRVFQKLRDSEAMKKALAYLDKALLLSPKNLALYTTAASLHASFRDLNELQKLRQKFQLAAPDISQSREEVLKAFSGAKDEEYLERLQAEVRNLEELARNPRVQEHPLTHDLVTLLLVGERLNTTVYGAVIDADEQIRLALAAYERHPTSMARGTLQNACYFKAAEELASQHPEFAALRERTRRVLGPETLFALMLDRGGPMAEIALRNANVQKGLALEKEIIQRHTAWSSSLQWALLRNTDAALAATVAERIRQNEAIRVSDELQYWLNPVNARSVLDLYWTKRILGDDAGAQEIYRTALRDGVPLPPL